MTAITCTTSEQYADTRRNLIERIYQSDKEFYKMLYFQTPMFWDRGILEFVAHDTGYIFEDSYFEGSPSYEHSAVDVLDEDEYTFLAYEYIGSLYEYQLEDEYYNDDLRDLSIDDPSRVDYETLCLPENWQYWIKAPIQHEFEFPPGTNVVSFGYLDKPTSQSFGTTTPPTKRSFG